jgi:VanZ family protein
MGFIFYLSSQSQLPGLGRYGVKDWMEHGAEYVVLGAMAAKAAAGTWPWSAGLCGGFAVILGTGYGLSDEIHQRFVPGRKCDARDWSADVAGSALGALAFLVWSRFEKRRRSNV